MPGSGQRLTLVLVLLVTLAATPVLAAFEPAAVKEEWSVQAITHWINANLPPAQLSIGILIGLAAGELLRLAWRTLEWLLCTIYVFAKVTARYGAIAAVIGCVLYFI